MKAQQSNIIYSNSCKFGYHESLSQITSFYFTFISYLHPFVSDTTVIQENSFQHFESNIKTRQTELEFNTL